LHDFGEAAAQCLQTIGVGYFDKTFFKRSMTSGGWLVSSLAKD
jgi:hypothetical protein